MWRLISAVAVLTMLAGLGQTTAGEVWELSQTYVNPIPGNGDWFGTSIAAVGNNVVVGVGYHDILMEDDGAAYLFNGKTGELLQTFDHPVPHTGDQFGRSVASAGDNVLVGAPSSAYTPDPTPGAAYLFGTSGNLLQTFENPTPNTNDGFGYSVAATSEAAVISAPNDDTRGGNAGAAYLFDLSGNLQTTFFSPAASSGAYFGSSVAIAGENILIGEGGADEAAYLFDASGNSLQTFEKPAGTRSGHFGQTVASLGDDVLIDALDGEHAYLFDSETGDVSQTFFNPIPGETFGHGIAGAGQNVFVGAPSLTMHLFDATSGDLLHTFDNPGGKIGAPIVVMGNGVLTGGGGTTYLFKPIPEPSTLALLAMAVAAIGIGWWRRRRSV